MKLYKSGKCMQMVDSDQVQICLDAGWSKTDKVAEKAEVEAEVEAEVDAEADAEKDTSDESSKKIKRIKLSSKK